MTDRELAALFTEEGYRFCQGSPKEVGLHYKYYEEGFGVVMVVDLTHGYELTPEQQRIMEERVMGSFYHPQGILPDFPQGFPVYHVEVLTLLIGGADAQVRGLCAQCRNVWAYLPGERRLLIYENQPGDFLGLRKTLERVIYGTADARAGYKEGAETAGKSVYRSGIGRSIAELKRHIRDGSMPYVTVLLAAVNVIVFAVMEFLGDTENPLFVGTYGGLYPPFLSEQHEWWRLFTAGFVHFGIVHLVNNMVILCCMGSRMERLVGHLRVFIIYMLSLLGGCLLSYHMMIYTGEYAVSAGASGAIFGLIGGMLWLVMRNKGHLEGITARGILFMIALTVYYGFSSEGIDNWGHIGGVVTGFVAAIFLCRVKRQRY